MRLRRMLVTVATLVAGASCLTACSPGVDGVAGIGFDDDGHLVGGVKTCRSDTADASLGTDRDIVREWKRSTKGHGTETWRLDTPTDGRWRTITPPKGQLAEPGGFAFRVNSSDAGWFSIIDFTAAELAAVPPGHLLVELDGPPDADGYATTVVSTIALADLGRQPCQT